MNDLIRYEFLKDWVKNATIDEIIDKLILLDERTKQLDSLKGDNSLYYFKDICSGEIVDFEVFHSYSECLDYIKKQDYTFSNFEVIFGSDITSNFLKDLNKKGD